MPTWATDTPPPVPRRPRGTAGFTLLELMVVVAIAGMASALVALALRDASQSLLDREAQRLVSTLEAARAESRASGVALQWQATPGGFILTTGRGPRQERWESDDLQAAGPQAMDLGPEPVIGPQSVRLWHRDAPGQARWVRTDGLRSFEVRNSPPDAETSP